MLRRASPVLRAIGYRPRGPAVYPRVSGENLLEHFAVLKGIVERCARQEAIEALLLRARPQDVRKRFGFAVALLGNQERLMVDEPAARRDPTERLRFLKLLNDESEHGVVLLSTHVVEDARALRNRLAMIDADLLLRESASPRAIDGLRGRIWRRVLPKEALPELAREHPVTWAKLLAGRAVARTESDACPGPGFRPAEPEREDVYFSMIGG